MCLANMFGGNSQPAQPQQFQGQDYYSRRSTQPIVNSSADAPANTQIGTPTGGNSQATPLPPIPQAAATAADPAVQQARIDARRRTQREGGLAATQLTVNLGGIGAGTKKLAGTA